MAWRKLERAARDESLREEAVCLMAEASILAGQPAEGLRALNSMLLVHEGDAGGEASRSARVRLLRGVCGCMLGRAAAARRELAAIQRSEASVEELLAAAQACVMSADNPGALQLCELMEKIGVGGAVVARIKLCRAAIYYRRGSWQDALDALPSELDCIPADQAVVRVAREDISVKIAELELQASISGK